jgi:AbiV family abortive infection protein
MNSLAPPYRGPLSVIQVAEGMNAAAKNASRLASDARLLLANSRWPSATSMAALSIEESGKVVILRRFLTSTEDECKLLWKEYRSHTSKNVKWILPDLVANGARKLDDFRPLLDKKSDHPLVLDTVKQLGFYSDCLGGGHWSLPLDVVDESLAVNIVATAEVLAPKREVTVRELELWKIHMAPAFGTTLEAMKTALAHWYAQMQSEGLAPSGENQMETFVREGLTVAQATTLER